MLQVGPALRVVIHLNEDTASEGDYLHLEILGFLYSKGVSGATVFRGHSGFGSHHRIHTHGEAGTSGEHLPIRVEFIDSTDKVSALLSELKRLVIDGVIEMQECSIVHVATASRHPQAEDTRG